MKIGIIGLGNMGGAIHKRLSNVKDITLYGYDKDIKKIENPNQLKKLDELINLDYIILAIKPGELENIKHLKWKGTVISILAGTKCEKIKSVLPGYKVVRLMPNVPLLVGEGICGVYFDKALSETEKSSALELIESFSEAVVVEKEELINSITAVSGSGPAFVFMFIEAMADAAVKAGINRKDSYKLASQTLLGSAKMALETGKHPGELKDMVTSPSGTTIEGVAALEKAGFRNAVIEAVTSSFEKSNRMG